MHEVGLFVVGFMSVWELEKEFYQKINSNQFF